ncbi:thioredoxin domain-containing protein [Candidatus Saccharibacteria bacterium]|nr:thioredoxin domain-containing protein [Candidatus Saccharibacteria bacterium]
MKQKSFKKGVATGWVVAIVGVVAAFGAFVGYTISQKIASTDYDATHYIAGNQYNGDIPDHIIGSEAAKVLIVEYADYQCPGCATMFPRLKKLLENYSGDEVALIYRNFLLSYHQNGTAAASAAEAAGLQGYWQEYATYLFANQSAWEYASADQRTDLFAGYFDKVTEGKGDLAKFRQDMQSEAVSKKLSFDNNLAKKIDVSGTPSLYIDGEKIDLSGVKTEEDFLNFMKGKITDKLK